MTAHQLPPAILNRIIISPAAVVLAFGSNEYLQGPIRHITRTHTGCLSCPIIIDIFPALSILSIDMVDAVVALTSKTRPRMPSGERAVDCCCRR